MSVPFYREIHVGVYVIGVKVKRSCVFAGLVNVTSCTVTGICVMVVYVTISPVTVVVNVVKTGDKTTFDKLIQLEIPVGV